MQGTSEIPPDENTGTKKGMQGNPQTWEAYPTKRGFDYYYGYVRHMDGHEHYPKEGARSFPRQVWENNNEVSAGLDHCYTADLFTARAKKWIADQPQRIRGNLSFSITTTTITPDAVTQVPAATSCGRRSARRDAMAGHAGPNDHDGHGEAG